MSRPVQPGEFKRRVYNGSGLDGTDRALLSYLAWYAEKHRDDEGWFAVDQDTVAKDSGFSRSTVQRRLPALKEVGWLQLHKVVRNGANGNRFETTQYRLAVPTKGVTVTHGNGRVPGVTVTHGSVLHSDAANGVTVTQQRRSSLPKAVDDGAPPSGGVGNGLERQNRETQAPPAPAQPQAAEPGDAEPEPQLSTAVESSEPQPATDTAVFAEWDAEQLAAETAQLANPVKPKDQDPLSIPCPEPGCVADTGEPCPGYKLNGQPHSRRRLAVYSMAAAS